VPGSATLCHQVPDNLSAKCRQNSPNIVVWVEEKFAKSITEEAVKPSKLTESCRAGGLVGIRVFLSLYVALKAVIPAYFVPGWWERGGPLVNIMLWYVGQPHFMSL